MFMTLARRARISAMIPNVIMGTLKSAMLLVVRIVKAYAMLKDAMTVLIMKKALVMANALMSVMMGMLNTNFLYQMHLFA